MGYLTLCSSVSIISQEVYYITVDANGTGDYLSVQQAVDASKAFPDKRVTVFIKNGIYREKVMVPACNNRLSFIGESTDKTIITWDDHFYKMNRGRNSTFYTYTLFVDADDFYAQNLTIENSAGPVGQAVALHVSGDRCVFRNCRIRGNQDTLYSDGFYSRQYFEGCYIEGTTDFIFGSATVLFKNCTINSKANSYITAASTPEDKEYGFIFLDCLLTADQDVDEVFLGRPWRDYARTVFLNCELGSHIRPEGWSNWAGTSRDKTAYYAEYNNHGPGADISRRATWSRQLTRWEAARYTVQKILAKVASEDIPVSRWITGEY